MTEKTYHLSNDPIFFGVASIFALLTTGLLALLGLERFLPLAQAVALTLFMAVPLRQHNLRSALVVVFLWLVLSMGTIMGLTWLFPSQIELAIADGFMYRAAFLEWYYANSPLPASFGTQLVPSLLEIVGITLGSLATGGLVGAWFLVKAANLAAYGAGALLFTLGTPLLLPVAVPVWSILQLIGGGGLLVLLAEPLISGRFRDGIDQLVRVRRRPLVIFAACYALGLLLEFVLSPFWHFTM